MNKLIICSFILAGVLLLNVNLQAATSWYLPEGSTDGFDLWILVTNPTSSTAEVKFTFYRSGASTLTQTTSIAANSRYSLSVNNVSDMGNYAVSTKVESTNLVNIYAERAMYYPSGQTWTWGHSARGVSGLEGCYTEIVQPSSFPIAITQAGSYKLVSDINCTDEDTHAITVSADNVHLDLNGFTITGPGCNSGSEGCGIYMGSVQENFTVSNGSIRDFRASGIATAADSENIHLMNLNIYSNGVYGVSLQGYSGIVKDCVFSSNGINEDLTTGGTGLFVNYSTLVVNNVFEYNKGFSIEIASTGNCIKDNIVHNTQSAGSDYTAGIRVRSTGSGNRIEGNTCAANSTRDLYIQGGLNIVINNSLRTGSSIAATNATTVTNQGNTTLAP